MGDMAGAFFRAAGAMVTCVGGHAEPEVDRRVDWEKRFDNVAFVVIIVEAFF